MYNPPHTTQTEDYAFTRLYSKHHIFTGVHDPLKGHL